MEFMVVLIIAIVICLILNVSLYYILSGILILVGIITVLFSVSFLYCFIVLLCSKCKEAEFVRIGPAKGERFQVAFYMVDGEAYPCMFPREAILEDKLYRKDRKYRVMWNSRKGKVFDRYACMTCVLGLLVSVALSVGIAYVFL
ncbi:MAG: hypothetical protein IKK33_01805 [Lachnospiraceae bacterium]|nr:hypothetical protein [Lachnospiraceae bacterium]